MECESTQAAIGNDERSNSSLPGCLGINWSEEQRQLWQRLTDLTLDAPDVSFCFSRRLAQENSWSIEYSRRVVEEYKRFLFLCLSADHASCPSDQVDQAWHLHLTYTRLYWTQLCQQTLQRPLHHEATRGGPAQHQKHVDMYQQTLNSYRSFFHCDAPADIWPPVEKRFGLSVKFRRVNTRDYWVIPHPWKAFLGLSRAFQRAVSSVFAAALILPLAVNIVNPFEMVGPDFLMLYAALYVVALIAALIVRSSLYQGHAAADREELTPYEAAALGNNSTTAVGAAVCRLVHDEYLQEVSSATETNTEGPVFLRTNKVADRNADVLETAILQTAENSSSALTFKELYSAGLPALSEIDERLQVRDLKPGSESHPLRLLPSAIMFMLLFFGLVKVAIGVSRHRNVGLLVVFCIITCITMLVVYLRPAMTAAGKRVLQRFKAKASVDKARISDGTLSGHELAAVVGVYGLALVTAPHLLGVQSAWKSAFPSTSTASGCSTSSCSGGGDGGGGGGCGGCGGD